jgi:hypothetical protein
MLGLMRLLRRISLIGLMAFVLSLFVCRPLLSLGVRNQGISAGTICAANGPGRRLARTLIRQLDSQFQEADSKPQKPHLAVSRYNPSRKTEAGLSSGEEPILLADRRVAFPPGLAVPLRI